MIRKILAFLVLLGLTFIIWQATQVAPVCFNPFWMVLIAVGLWLSVAYLGSFLRRTNPKVWLFAGLAVLAGLIWPTASIAESFPGQTPLQMAEGYAIFFLPSLAVIISALLLYAGIKLSLEHRQIPREFIPRQIADRRRALRRASLLCFALCALILTRMLYNWYELIIWDGATDSLDYLCLITPLVACLVAGAGLTLVLPGKAKIAAIYGLLLPALMIAVTAQAETVNFRQLTNTHAARVNQLIQAYDAREGRYPQGLSQLVPWYTLYVPGPVILYGQDWCYNAGDGYYRLAYVDREHWSNPGRFAHIYASQGQVLQEQRARAKELADMIQNDPKLSIVKEKP